MAQANKILITQEKRRFIHPLISSSELKKTACSKFSLDNSTSIVIQIYNESWGEYINILQDDDLIPGCKYRVILLLPSVLYVEGSSTHKGNKNSSDIISQDIKVINSLDLCKSSNLKNSSNLDGLSSSAETYSSEIYFISVLP